MDTKEDFSCFEAILRTDAALHSAHDCSMLIVKEACLLFWFHISPALARQISPSEFPYCYRVN